jgi:hypothetical protein
MEIGDNIPLRKAAADKTPADRTAVWTDFLWLTQPHASCSTTPGQPNLLQLSLHNAC